MRCYVCLKLNGHYIECPIGADIEHLKRGN